MLNRLLKPILSRLPENNRLERIWKLAQVEFRRRFYNDKLGIFWAFLNPVFRVAVYYWVFTYIFKKVVEDIPNYALFLFCGIIIWMSFTETSKKCMKVLVKKNYLIESIQVNKVDLYYSTAIATALGFLFNLSAYLLICFIFGLPINIFYLWIPLLVLNIFFLSVGLGMFLSVIFIYFKDIDHILDIVFLFGFWSSGIFFKGQIFYEIFPPIIYINPFIGLIMNMRAIIMENASPDMFLLMINFAIGLLVFTIGYFTMRNYSYAAVEKK